MSYISTNKHQVFQFGILLNAPSKLEVENKTICRYGFLFALPIPFMKKTHWAILELKFKVYRA